MIWWLFPLPLIILALFFGNTLDLAVARHFYSPQTASFIHSPFLDFVRTYGHIPVFLLACIALWVGALSFWKTSWRRWRKSALFVLLCLAVGNLLLVTLCKDYWPRPRPFQTDLFGGSAPYTPFYKRLPLSTPQLYQSFPSGHAASGFSLLTLYFVGKRMHKRSLCLLGIFLPCLCGIGLAFTRIAQGEHYLTDTLFSALFIWYCCLFFDALLYRRPQTLL